MGRSFKKEIKNKFIGTPYWMAPEVIQNVKGLRPYNELVDIWSLGITCIECAQCDPPLAHLDPFEAMCVIPIAPPPSLSEKEMHWSNNFKDFVKQSLTKDPNDRPSAADLLKHPLFNNLNTEPFIELITEDIWDGWSWEESDGKDEIKFDSNTERLILSSELERRNFEKLPSNSFEYIARVVKDETLHYSFNSTKKKRRTDLSEKKLIRRKEKLIEEDKDNEIKTRSRSVSDVGVETTVNRKTKRISDKKRKKKR